MPIALRLLVVFMTPEREVTGDIPKAQSCIAYRTSQLARVCTVGYDSPGPPQDWGPGEWLGVVQRVLLVPWYLGAALRGVVWGALTVSVVAAGVRCGRRCRLRCRLGWCTRRAIRAHRGLLLVLVHMGVCCAEGVPVGRCWLLCVVFPVCACVPLLPVCMLCGSNLCYGFLVLLLMRIVL